MVQLVWQHLRPDLHMGLRDGAVGEDLFHQRSFQFSHATFHPTVVRRIMRWRVQRDDQVTGQHLIDGLMIEIGTVVAFERERLRPSESRGSHAGHCGRA